jgi:hypothetical protein
MVILQTARSSIDLVAISSQHNGITLAGSPQPTFATKSAHSGQRSADVAEVS